MQIALDLARLAASRDEVPVGAVLVCKEEIIGQGSNERETLKRTVAHAEVRALEDYSQRTGQWRLPPETTLYVTVEPCLMCTGALLWARVDSVLYGCSDPKGAGIQAVLPLIQRGTYDHRFKAVQGGIEEVPCSELMKGFFRLKRMEKAEAPAPPIYF